MVDIENLKKGLGLCTHHDGTVCPDCPYWKGECVDDMSAEALYVINQLQAEIDKLKSDKAKADVIANNLIDVFGEAKFDDNGIAGITREARDAVVERLTEIRDGEAKHEQSRNV